MESAIQTCQCEKNPPLIRNAPAQPRSVETRHMPITSAIPAAGAKSATRILASCCPGTRSMLAIVRSSHSCNFPTLAEVVSAKTTPARAKTAWFTPILIPDICSLLSVSLDARSAPKFRIQFAGLAGQHTSAVSSAPPLLDKRVIAVRCPSQCGSLPQGRGTRYYWNGSLTEGWKRGSWLTYARLWIRFPVTKVLSFRSGSAPARRTESPWRRPSTPASVRTGRW